MGYKFPDSWDILLLILFKTSTVSEQRVNINEPGEWQKKFIRIYQDLVDYVSSPQILHEGFEI